MMILKRICPLCHRLRTTNSLTYFNRYLFNKKQRIQLLARTFSSASSDPNKKVQIDLSQFPVENIRNFSIIAHVDHGKSTLADRLLELTGTISKDEKNEQVLDTLQVERERGITVKAQTASLLYSYNDTTYLLNLIDTPGHVDFSYEVSRSLSACQGVVLLVDAGQGVQAQTVANFFLAFEKDLTIVPVLNKIDQKVAKPEVVLDQMKNLFEFEQSEVLKISAKFGTGVEDVLKTIIEKVPPPPSKPDLPLKAFVFDSWYDIYRGVIAQVAVIDGKLMKGDKIESSYTKIAYETQEVGILYPTLYPTGVLYSGQVGYVMMNMKKTDEAQIGDTFHLENNPVDPLPGFKPAKAMVFAGIFPNDQSEFVQLRNAVERLTLNDSSVTVNMDSSPALGQGWRLGFLGLLHMDVFKQRLEQEYNMSVIITTPNVPYKVKIVGAKNIKQYGGEEITIVNPCLLPDTSIITEYYEPMVLGTIISPDDRISDIVNLCLEKRGVNKDQTYIDNTRVLYKVILPLNEILLDFYDDLKAISSGYASFDYEDYGYMPTSLVKLDFLINGKEIEDLTMICHTSKARNLARQVCSRLKESIARQLYSITLQSKVGTKVLAREDIRALKKDVLAKCYGGDVTRKMKLLRHQAEGKKRMRQVGNIQVPRDAFINALKRS